MVDGPGAIIVVGGNGVGKSSDYTLNLSGIAHAVHIITKVSLWGMVLLRVCLHMRVGGGYCYQVVIGGSRVYVCGVW